MNKKIISVIIAAAMLSGLTACGNTAEEADVTAETASSETVSEETSEETSEEHTTASETTAASSETTTAAATTSATTVTETETTTTAEETTAFETAAVSEEEWEYPEFTPFDEAEGTPEEKDRETLGKWLEAMRSYSSSHTDRFDKWHFTFYDYDEDGYYDIIFNPCCDTVTSSDGVYPDVPEDLYVSLSYQMRFIYGYAGDNYCLNSNAEGYAVLNPGDDLKTSEVLIIGYNNNPYDPNGYSLMICDTSFDLNNPPRVYYYSDSCDIPEKERNYGTVPEKYFDKYGWDKSLCTTENDSDDYYYPTSGKRYYATAEFGKVFEQFADDMKAKYDDNPLLEGVFTAEELADITVDDFIARLSE